MNVYEELRAVNVNEHTEKKNNLTYLSWAWAWDEVMRRYPGAEYEIKEFEFTFHYVSTYTISESSCSV